MCTVVFCLVLITGLAFGQDVPAPKAGVEPTTDLHDLQLGMPRDYVLAGLAGHYKLTHAYNPSDPSKGVDVWQVLSGDTYAGDVVFKDGKLALATMNRYYKEGGGKDHELVERLFALLFDNSGQSTITEGPLGMMTRSRSAMIRLDAIEQGGTSNVKSLRLHFEMLQGNAVVHEYILSVTTLMDGNRTVALDEGITKKWQARTGK
jgi:hypothetical protein